MLTRKATLQARHFDAVLSSFHPATEVADGFDDLLRVDLDDGQHVLARCVISATGARWRRLHCAGHDRLEGAGVYYTATATDVSRCAGEDVVVIGGGNSAGQAAVQLARRARSVRLVVRRGGLVETMSRYLVDRLESAPNVELIGHHEPVEFHGDDALRAVTIQDRRTGARTRLECPAAFVMIGATPCSEPLRHVVAMDSDGFVLCGKPASTHEGTDCRWPVGDREPGFLESSRPGIFVAGDLRSGATNRVAGAVGDGALAVRLATTCSPPETPARASGGRAVAADGRDLAGLGVRGWIAVAASGELEEVDHQLERVVEALVHGGDDPVVIHAMSLRPRFRPFLG
jgi:thioredoxin reductase (NADPH)